MNIVKELCDRNGITQKQLAKMVGVSQPSVSGWFNQKADPTGERLEKLVNIFGVNRAVILGYDKLNDITKNDNSDYNETINLFRQLNEEQLDKVIEYMLFLLSQKK